MDVLQAVVEVKTPNVTYILPTQQINIDNVLESYGSNVKLKDIKLSIEITKASEQDTQFMKDIANKGNFTIIVQPYSFSVKATYREDTVDISRFNSYVERTIALPEDVNPSKITTGIVIEPDGTFRHMPTRITVIGGKYYAKINSLTNSNYTAIWNPKKFKDIENHWAKKTINDMGSRMIISGVGDDMFEPKREITRAEFAAILVRALGLKPGIGNNSFSDVAGTDWYCDYVKTATKYNLITGYGNGKFGPMDNITREQAIVMITRAMSMTGLKVEFTDGEKENILKAFKDANESADYAKESLAVCIKSGVVCSRDGELVAPKDNISRAEVATIVQRLLQKSNLIHWCSIK
ncbi:MAG TPA: hypothetical protein DCP10_10175, partial [Bacteroidales bacterium]|nr:hypothetical protein [Bacteroidales bacterium]